MRRDKPIMDRFAQYVMPEPNTGCHLWTGPLNSAGRPRFYAVCKSPIRKPKRVLASRWIGEAKFGPLPAGWHIHHTCATGLCVNPDHLMPMEGREHVSQHSRMDEVCGNGHVRTPENTYWRKDRPGQRQCLDCRRDRRRDRSA